MADFGVDHLAHLLTVSDFPWILTNVFDAKSKEPLGNAAKSVIFPWRVRSGCCGAGVCWWQRHGCVVIVTVPCGATLAVAVQGRRIGVVGMVEEEWISTLGSVDPDNVLYVDYVEECKREADSLRFAGADCVIALSHMRMHNDRRLARECAGTCPRGIVGPIFPGHPIPGADCRFGPSLLCNMSRQQLRPEPCPRCVCRVH